MFYSTTSNCNQYEWKATIYSAICSLLYSILKIGRLINEATVIIIIIIIIIIHSRFLKSYSNIV